MPGHVVIWGHVTDVDAAVIDAGDGDRFDKVLAFCHGHAGQMAGKGASGTRPAIQAPQSKLKNERGRLWIIGSDGWKG